MKSFISTVLALAASTTLSVVFITITGYAINRFNRFSYSRATHPRNIEKNSQEMMEHELQQLLLEERIKQRLESQRQHPASLMKPDYVKLDDETKEILAKLANQRPSRRDRNNKFWWGE